MPTSARINCWSAGLEQLREIRQGTLQATLTALGCQPGTDDLQIEGSPKAGGQDELQQACKRYRTITGDRAARQTSVTQYIVTDLRQCAHWTGRGDGLLDIGIRPAREEVDPNTDSRALRQCDRIRKAMRDRSISIQV